VSTISGFLFPISASFFITLLFRRERERERERERKREREREREYLYSL